MDADLIESFLKNNPKARRAKDGIIIETEEGLLHLTNFIKENGKNRTLPFN